MVIWRVRYSVSCLPAAAKVAIVQAAKVAVLVVAVLPALTAVAAEVAAAVPLVHGANVSDFHDPFSDMRQRQKRAQGSDEHLTLDHTRFHSAQPTENRSPLMCHRYIL